MNTLFYIRRFGIVLLVLFLITSCDSLIYEHEGDCLVSYRLKFRYDMNLKFADAFAHEVKSVRLYAFNMEGELVWQASEQGEVLASENYVMTLDLAPGKYRLVAWCGLGNEESFVCLMCHRMQSRRLTLLPELYLRNIGRNFKWWGISCLFR